MTRPDDDISNLTDAEKKQLLAVFGDGGFTADDARTCIGDQRLARQGLDAMRGLIGSLWTTSIVPLDKFTGTGFKISSTIRVMLSVYKADTDAADEQETIPIIVEVVQANIEKEIQRYQFDIGYGQWKTIAAGVQLSRIGPDDIQIRQKN